MTTGRQRVEAGLRRLYGDIGEFSRGVWPGWRLRPYQVEAARAIAGAVRQGGQAGGPNQLAVVFSRQAGKDEMLAQLLAYLLNLYQFAGGQVVLAAPTGRQAQISRARLLERLDNPLNRGQARGREGYIVGLGRASVHFLSADPASNARGETANRLLVANEAQDIDPARWDAVFDPMAASTNATTLFVGTVWTASTLLARQMRHLRDLEAGDGQRRVFMVDWEQVARYVPAYGERVAERIAQFGPNHPFIQTEYMLKELNGSGGWFGPERRALMAGSHSRQAVASPGKIYALLVDVAGEGEGDMLKGAALRAAQPRKDSTAVTVVEVVRPGSAGEPMQPHYRVVQRYVWTGLSHPVLYGRLVGLARDTWAARYVVVDATGLGAPLAGFLAQALPGGPGRPVVVPFVFSAVSKSELGWHFAGIVDSGRYKEYAQDGADDTAWFWRQLAAVEYDIRPGPGQLLRWSVPDPTLHDDLVMSAALTAVLDRQDWRERKATALPDRDGW